MIALTIALPAPSPTPDAQAEDIFARTRAAFTARAFPSTIEYAVRISGLRGSTWTARTYEAFEDWPDATVFARSISDEEAADPVKPPPFCFFGLGAPKRSGTALPDILGYPKLAVTYSFGLGGRPSPVAADGNDSSLRTIGFVHAMSRNYDVRLAGEETVDDHPCWHLTLVPLGNPGTYRLRDLWVDESSYQTRRLVTEGNFTTHSTGSGLWTVSYRQDGDAWYLASEVSHAPVSGMTGKYDRIAVQFLNVASDPHENLDFGLAGSNEDKELTEPPE